MSEEKTSKYYVRLKKGFPSNHRRAGHTFVPGPTYQELDLTEEQAETIKADPAFEVGTSSEAKRTNEMFKKQEDSQTGATDEQQDPANVSGEADDGTTPQAPVRTTGRDATRYNSPEGFHNHPIPQKSQEEGGDSRETLMSYGRSQLVALATDVGVKDADKKKSKAEIVDAILEKRDTDEAAEQRTSTGGDVHADRDPDSQVGEDPTDNDTNPTANKDEQTDKKE